jgi:hypothetical protein
VAPGEGVAVPSAKGGFFFSSSAEAALTAKRRAIVVRSIDLME